MSEGRYFPWKELRGVSEGDGILEVPSISAGVNTGFGPARYALGSKGQLRLLVPCGPDARLRHGKPNGNLALGLSRYGVAGQKTLFIDLVCTNHALDHVFAELVDGIIQRLEVGHPPQGAVADTIDDFRNLLRDPQQPEIPDHRIIGLIGELVVLNRLVQISQDAIASWTGPQGQRHDFRSGNHALEVKTSVGSGASVVTIANSTQLATPTDGTLMLIHVLVERAEHGELGVSPLCLRILDSGVANSDLRKALSPLGCTDPDDPDWNRLRFALEKIHGYRVDQNFPCITPASFAGYRVPTGIVALNYSLNLQAAQDHLLTEAELSASLIQVAS